jgi:hypothetical protein
MNLEKTLYNVVCNVQWYLSFLLSIEFFFPSQENDSSSYDCTFWNRFLNNVCVLVPFFFQVFFVFFWVESWYITFISVIFLKKNSDVVPLTSIPRRI